MVPPQKINSEKLTDLSSCISATKHPASLQCQLNKLQMYILALDAILAAFRWKDAKRISARSLRTDVNATICEPT